MSADLSGEVRLENLLRGVSRDDLARMLFERLTYMTIEQFLEVMHRIDHYYPDITPDIKVRESVQMRFLARELVSRLEGTREGIEQLAVILWHSERAIALYGKE